MTPGRVCFVLAQRSERRSWGSLARHKTGKGNEPKSRQYLALSVRRLKLLVQPYYVRDHRMEDGVLFSAAGLDIYA